MNTLPKFTEGPWKKDKYGILKCPKGEPIKLWGSGFVYSSRNEETEANNKLTEASHALYMALWAQEVASEMQKELAIPDPQDPRYEPFLGPYDGYKAPEIRFHDFMVKRQQLRTEALKQARGE